MTKKKSGTPLYDSHKKVHDLVGKLQDLNEDEHSTGLASAIHEVASEYLHKNKDSDGKVNWEAKGGDKEHKKFTDNLWSTAADRIATDYLKLSDEAIKELKGKKTPEGESAWETFIANYMGGLDKETFFDKVKNENELTIENILRSYTNKLAGEHVQYRHGALLRKNIETPEDSDMVASYLGKAKKHNKKSLKPLKTPKRFKSIHEAMNTLSTASQYVPKGYHPDKKDTYN
ncbi:hypothetical protein ACFL3V_00440 [Nanoarchaeota archaeon]